MVHNPGYGSLTLIRTQPIAPTRTLAPIDLTNVGQQYPHWLHCITNSGTLSTQCHTIIAYTGTQHISDQLGP